jgi:hypothetical protein
MVPISCAGVDDIWPTASQIGEELTDFYKKRVYFELDDNSDSGNANQTITIISPNSADVGKLSDAGSAYDGCYYLDFSDNNAKQILFRDMFGLTGSLSLSLEEPLDMTIPQASVKWWSPAARDSEGNAISDQMPNFSTNTYITVSLDFNTEIESIEWLKWSYWQDLFELPTTFDIDKVSINAGSKSAEVTIRDNVRIKLLLRGKNGVVGTYEIDLNSDPNLTIIDRDPPILDVTTDEPTDSSQTASVTASFFVQDGPVYAYDCGDSSRLYQNGDTITAVIKSNGEHEFRFSDPAGNMITETVNISKIDNAPPDIVISGVLDDSQGRVQGPVTFMATLARRKRLLSG